MCQHVANATTATIRHAAKTPNVRSISTIPQNTKNKKVTIGSNMTITFNDGKTINFKEKKFGYFKFVKQKLNKIITIADTENISNNINSKY
jgi:hypothetical protein